MVARRQKARDVSRSPSPRRAILAGMNPRPSPIPLRPDPRALDEVAVSTLGPLRHRRRLWRAG